MQPKERKNFWCKWTEGDSEDPERELIFLGFIYMYHWMSTFGHHWLLVISGSLHHWAGSFEDPDGLQGDEREKGKRESGKDEWQQY